MVPRGALRLRAPRFSFPILPKIFSSSTAADNILGDELRSFSWHQIFLSISLEGTLEQICYTSILFCVKFGLTQHIDGTFQNNVVRKINNLNFLYEWACSRVTPNVHFFSKSFAPLISLDVKWPTDHEYSWVFAIFWVFERARSRCCYFFQKC